MKKQAVVSYLLIMSAALQAQTKLDTSKVIKANINPVPVKTIIKQPVSSAPVNTTSTNTQTKSTGTQQTQPVLTDAEYFLAGAVLKINTGNDNKEANTSTAYFYVRPRKSGGAAAYKLEDYANEIKANQATDLRLDRSTTLNTAQNSLQYFKQNGLSVVIAYCNKNFCTDAWKINSITLTLEFKDANGNPAPAGYASRTISFPVSGGTLGFVAGCNPFWITDGKSCGHSDQLQKMLLKTDEYFNPMPAKLLGWWTDDVN
ncbi:MAG: hypothetical protein JST86_01800 [Bacteroidetes bacterium]|nr:hypothetical protein [Bacteroidota bacterium]